MIRNYHVPSRVGASQNSESAGKKKKKKERRRRKEKRQGGAYWRKRELIERGGKGEPHFRSPGGRKEELQDSKPCLQLSIFMSVLSPQRQSLVCPFTNAQWVTGSFPEVELQDSGRSFSPKSSEVASLVMDCLSVRYVLLIWGQIFDLKLWRSQN